MTESFIEYQRQFDIKCEWGADAIENLYEETDVFVIVDILSFTTCVDIATSRQAIILPYRHKDESALGFAKQYGAELAGHRSRKGSFSLSPVSMLGAKKGQRIVLPSPNGASLSILAKDKPILAGCIRNARAIAVSAQNIGKRVTVVPSGERWPNGNIRFALEDAIGAGAIISYMSGIFSPEAQSLRLLFEQVKSRLADVISECTSGNELINRDAKEDLEIASLLNASSNVPFLKDGFEYVALTPENLKPATE